MPNIENPWGLHTYLRRARCCPFFLLGVPQERLPASPRMASSPAQGAAIFTASASRSRTCFVDAHGSTRDRRMWERQSSCAHPAPGPPSSPEHQHNNRKPVYFERPEYKMFITTPSCSAQSHSLPRSGIAQSPSHGPVQATLAQAQISTEDEGKIVSTQGRGLQVSL